MMTLNEIETAVSQLPSEELAQFRQWLAEFDGERWDQQLEQDARAGKLDKLADKASDPLSDVRASTGISDLAEHFDDYRFGRRHP